MTSASDEFRAWVDRNGTGAEWEALQTAFRSPRALRDANLRNRKKGHPHAPIKAKSMAFTLNQKTADWLNQMSMPHLGSKSATVEIALARYRLFYPMLRMIEDLLDEIKRGRPDPAQSLSVPKEVKE